ncbi:hypothetical protein T439DRAFT_325488 [Meredithblackwellia eburnea MCA 4105]
MSNNCINSRLPIEVVRRIIELRTQSLPDALTPHPFVFTAEPTIKTTLNPKITATEFLLDCSTVCKRWHAVANDLLPRRLVLRDLDSLKRLGAIRTDTNKSACIESVFICQTAGSLMDVLNKLPNVQRLAWSYLGEHSRYLFSRFPGRFVPQHYQGLR